MLKTPRQQETAEATPRASRSVGHTRSSDNSLPLTNRAFSLADKSCARAP
jgi:hypothetical protein